MKTRILILFVLPLLLLGTINISDRLDRLHDHREIRFYEAPVEVEEWMTHPFDTNTYLAEEDIEIEKWMTQPFM